VRFVYTVEVECGTDEQADRVMTERLGFDEDYGFRYSISWFGGDPKTPEFDGNGEIS